MVRCFIVSTPAYAYSRVCELPISKLYLPGLAHPEWSLVLHSIVLPQQDLCGIFHIDKDFVCLDARSDSQYYHHAIRISYRDIRLQLTFAIYGEPADVQALMVTFALKDSPSIELKYHDCLQTRSPLLGH